MASVGGSHIVGDQSKHEIFREAVQAGWDVVEKKGHTNFAISVAAALAVEAMVWDTRRTMPC